MTAAEPAVGVLIVDDQAPFRAVARTVVDLAPGFEVVGEAESAEDALDLAATTAPGLVLMDINLPGMSGIDAARALTADGAGEVQVVLLSTYTEADLPAGARSCGALAYVHKEDLSPALLRQLWDGAQLAGG